MVASFTSDSAAVDDKAVGSDAKKAAAGSAPSSACEDLQFCLSDSNCASGNCRRFRGSLTLKVCAPLVSEIVVDASVRLSGVSADTFDANARAAFLATVASVLPSTDLASVEIVEVRDLVNLTVRILPRPRPIHLFYRAGPFFYRSTTPLG